MRPPTGSRDHRFGGDWTTQKLDILGQYLNAYTTALKKMPFKKAFIDAFAGSGYRTTRRETEELDASQTFLFTDLADSAPQALLDGSARIALQTEPAFDTYLFIERHAQRVADLQKLKHELPELAARIVVRQGEANTEIQRLCALNWHRRRAVLFLDPYGLQVEWQTIEAAARTRAIDLWVLFPLGIGVNRLLTTSGDIPPAWRHRLNLLLGTDTWYDDFYRVVRKPTLFGGDEERVIKASTETIGRYFNDRLKTIFAGVAKQPAVLRNSTNSPLYLLCFAAGNPTGKDIALRIANHLLEKVR